MIVLLAPMIYLAAAFYLRSVAGPFWHWNLLDPSYFYLLDGLNLLAGRPPGHVAHPGVTVSSLGAVWLRLQEAGGGNGEFVRHVLSNPEIYLHQLSTIYIIANALALGLLGYVACRAFGAVIPAVTCQLAPFMSTIILKHAIMPKPEAMLVMVTLALMSLLLLATRGPASGRLAAGFGLVAGFGLATKVTAAPIFLIPLFVLADRRAVVIYVAVAVAAAAAFFLPAAGALDAFASWLVKVIKGAGPHGSGPQTVIDWAGYPAAVAKVLKRPALKAPLAFAALSLAIAAWRSRRGALGDIREYRCLAGITVAQAVHVLLVAKQPTAFYLIPSYMLSSLSVLFSIRLLWSLRPATWRPPVSGGLLACLVIAGFAIGQGGGLYRLAGYFAATAAQTRAVDSQDFRHCARIFIYSASAPVFALFLADRVTGFHHAKELAALYPGKNYWIDDWTDQSDYALRDWNGVHKFADVRDAAQCLFFRGNRPNGIRNFINRTAPDLAYDAKCTVGVETIATVNVDCHGKAGD